MSVPGPFPAHSRPTRPLPSSAPTSGLADLASCAVGRSRCRCRCRVRVREVGGVLARVLSAQPRQSLIAEDIDRPVTRRPYCPAAANETVVCSGCPVLEKRGRRRRLPCSRGAHCLRIHSHHAMRLLTMSLVDSDNLLRRHPS